MIDKLLIMYTPDRTQSKILNFKSLDKIVYDCVEMRDGELMINSGICNCGPKSKFFYTGGLNSLLPFLELLNSIALLNKTDQLPLNSVFNSYLKLVM
jgi:hypothetical protein